MAKESVTPRAGVWIEIGEGLRCVALEPVTPRAGVWIEIGHRQSEHGTDKRHSPCGSVD